MNVTYADIYAARLPLSELIERELPIKVAVKLAVLAEQFNTHLKVIEQLRNKLIQKYGRDADGKLVVDEQCAEMNMFIEKFNELMREEVHIDHTPVVLPENIAMKPSTIMPLLKFIEVPNG